MAQAHHAEQVARARAEEEARAAAVSCARCCCAGSLFRVFDGVAAAAAAHFLQAHASSGTPPRSPRQQTPARAGAPTASQHVGTVVSKRDEEKLRKAEEARLRVVHGRLEGLLVFSVIWAAGSRFAGAARTAWESVFRCEMCVKCLARK